MKQINTTDAPEAIGPYSQAIKANGFIFCSGQIPLQADGTLNKGQIEDQTTQVIENLKKVLEAADSSLNNAVKVTVYLSNMEDFQRMNEIYAKYFKKPARACIQAAKLPKDVKVEMDVIAI